MSQIDPKRLRTVGTLITADGRMLNVEHDPVAGRAAITDDLGGVLSIAGDIPAAWRHVRYSAGVTHTLERSPHVVVSQSYRQIEDAQFRAQQRGDDNG